MLGLWRRGPAAVVFVSGRVTSFQSEAVPHTGDNFCDAAIAQGDVFPWIGQAPVAGITPPQLLEVLRRIESRGVVEPRTGHCAQVSPLLDGLADTKSELSALQDCRAGAAHSFLLGGFWPPRGGTADTGLLDGLSAVSKTLQRCSRQTTRGATNLVARWRGPLNLLPNLKRPTMTSAWSQFGNGLGTM